NHSKAAIPETLELDQDFGWLIGAYLAEGTHTANYIAITNISQEYLDRCAAFAKKYGINYRIKRQKGEYGESVSMGIYSTVLADFINVTCSKKSSGKKVPSFSYNANRKFIASILSAYFDGDGSISAERRTIRASSNSKELIDGISTLLSRLGIFATKRTDRKGQFWLNISRRYAAKFNEEICSAIPRKKAALERLAAITQSTADNSKSYDAVEMIPRYGALFESLGQKLGLPGRFSKKLTRKQKVGRKALARYKERIQSLAMRRGADISDELKTINQALNSDVVWDEIVALEYVGPSSEYVYDFSVEGLETFMTFDGIITHNTLNTFHFAGVAEMNITTGLPRIIEILDGRRKITTPMMEIYLKKPYSQGKDIKKMALYIKETRLSDMASEVTLNLAESRVEVSIDEEKAKELGITEAFLMKALKAANKSLVVDCKKGLWIFKAKKAREEKGTNDIYKSKEKIKDSYIRGVKGITQTLPVKKEGEFMIITAGSNLKKVLSLPFVDETRTTTNDIFEIEDVLGIEAARHALVSEVYRVIENQGLNVDIRHLMLVADTMCFNGRVKGITRYGVVKEKASVLARASFETPIKHIISASITGEVDKLNSVIENVMLNQVVPVGTGLPKLITKPGK
ncbi:intein-containing DNA-directed RNA polymerase subunit A'', partial [Candidatus Woesearchaeota archaeon]|nr:intein-containing DNA-directed RNA polymerase subunit A'' [Candidatus Woesearchaeota archaeon]